VTASLRGGLLGHPVAHSLSPTLHRAAGVAVGVDVDYALFDVEPADFEAALAACRDDARTCLNVTAPHKRAAWRVCAGRRTAAAERTGAVNTLWWTPAGWAGDNTDVEGFAALLGPIPPGRAVVVGAGGAARAVLDVLTARGVDAVDVVNRRPARARRLLAEMGLTAGRAHELAGLHGLLPKADLVVWALPPGAWAGEAAIDWSACPEGARLLHLAYGVAPAPLLRAAVAARVTAVDGLPMLAAQGLAAFARWTGLRAPPAPVVAALKAAVDAAPRAD
jgi:shikimate dehydrogenase